MILKNNRAVDKIYKGATEIAKIYKGSTLVYENYKDMIARANNAITINNAKANSLNYLKAFGKAGQKVNKLPNEYQEVEYLETSGGATEGSFPYIDTGYKANQDTRVIYDFELTEVTNKFIFGSQEIQNVWFRFGGSYVNKYTWLFWYGRNPEEVSFRAGEMTLGRHKIDANKNVWKIDETVLNEFTYESFQSNTNLYLFTINRTGYLTTVSSSCPSKLYSCKIFDNETLVRDFVPCYRKSDDVAGMYDIANDVFYTNAGTGEFTVGEDVINLPDEYQKVKYIESDGTQYINSGVIPNPRTKLEAKFFNNHDGSWYPLGRRNTSNDNFAFAIAGSTTNSTIFAAYNIKVTNSDLTRTSEGAIYETVLESKGSAYDFYIKDITNNKEFTATNVASGTLGTLSTTILIGAVRPTNILMGTTRWYSVKIKQSGNLVRHFVPCYRRLDNKPGLYDIVNDAFYTNRGTGEFTAGEVSSPSPSNPMPIYCNNGQLKVNQQGQIYADGIQETITSTHNNIVLYTAIVQNLYSLEEIKDVQELISGNIIRNVGVKVLDGTEEWSKSGTYNSFNSMSVITDKDISNRTGICSHFVNTDNVNDLSIAGRMFFGTSSQTVSFSMPTDICSTVQEWKQYLATQYANGTPVIVIYPLMTPITETATPQSINIQKGTNIIEVQQASLNDLEIEIKYKGK